jgi:hypothetical protein
MASLESIEPASSALCVLGPYCLLSRPSASVAATRPAEASHAVANGSDRGAPIESQLAWLASQAGQAFLNQPENLAALQLFHSGKLRKLLHRPDWARVGN